MPSVPLTPPTAAAKVNLHCRTSFVCIFLGCIASAYNQQQQQPQHHHPINLWTKAQSPFVQLAHFPVAALVKHACAASPRYRCCWLLHPNNNGQKCKTGFCGALCKITTKNTISVRPSVLGVFPGVC